MNEKPESKINELNKRLFSSSFKDRPIIEKLDAGDSDVSDTWAREEKKSVPLTSSKPSRQQNTLLKKVLIFSFSFFVIAVGFAFFYLYKGANLLSADNVNISIEGPISVSGGDTLNLGVVITNNNDAAIDMADLLIEYPEGAYASADSQTSLPRVRKSIGRIEPHQTIRENVSAVLFGETNSEKKIAVTFEFRLEGSSATLEKKKEHLVTVSTSPVDIAIEMLKEANLGQNIEIVVRLKSNSNTPLTGLLFAIDYPFGFKWKASTPVPNFDNRVWKVGDLAPSGELVIRISGTIEGQDEEEKIFRGHVGTQNSRDEKSLGVVYNSVSRSVFLKKPFLALDMLVDNERGQTFVSADGKSVRVDILWQNNLPTNIIDGEIQVKTKGDILDRFSINAGNGGFYRSSDDTILWNSKSGAVALGVIEPGEKGAMGFSFGFLPIMTKDGKRAFANPEVTLEATVTGRRVSDINVPEEINTFTAKTIRVESKENLASRKVHYVGRFKNSGLLPPKVNQETTYTVIWTMTNSSNNASGAIVRTTLPTYVKWLGVVSP